MAQYYKMLKSCWFMFALGLLLLNDFFLKDLYGNWLTGKLSDFAGLFIFPLFWTALLPRHKATIFWWTALFFVFWKSEYSQSFIESWNNSGLFHIGRTVDYSDLIALTVLPIAYTFENNKENVSKFKQLHPALPLFISAFAFMATSYINKVDINKKYHFNFSKNELINRFSKIDSLNFDRGVRFTSNNPDTIDFIIPSTYCFSNFDIKMVVTENNNKTVDLTLLSAVHHCEAKKKDKKSMTNEFEKLIIRKIK